MRVNFVGVIVLLLLILLQFGCSSSRSALDTSPDAFRCYYDGRIRDLGRPYLVVDFIQFKGPAKTRVDAYIEVPHSNLHFTTDGGDVLATEYTINITINDRQNNVVERKDLTRKVNTTRERVTRYGASDRILESFFLEPGEHRFIITILDRAVGNSFQVREVVYVNPMQADPIAMGDLLLIRSIKTENGRRVINPMLSNRVLTITEPFHVFTEIYSNNDHKNITLQYGLIRRYYNNDFLIENPFSYRAQRPYHRTGIFVENQDTIVLRDTVLALNSGTTQIFLPFDLTIDAGNYEIFVQNIGVENENADVISKSRTEFMTHALDFPHMTNVDHQIEALYYVASTRDLNNIRSGETPEDRRKLLNEYWQNIGAWKMSDYYERIRLANELFTTNVEGWKTPMGMVFIILGEPHFVECRIGIERMETWTYYLQTGGIEFTFVRERTADPADHKAHYWISSIRGGYSTWLNAINFWR
jgi:GWxTD domain-containing protein